MRAWCLNAYVIYDPVYSSPDPPDYSHILLHARSCTAYIYAHVHLRAYIYDNARTTSRNRKLQSHRICSKLDLMVEVRAHISTLILYIWYWHKSLFWQFMMCFIKCFMLQLGMLKFIWLFCDFHALRFLASLSSIHFQNQFWFNSCIIHLIYHIGSVKDNCKMNEGCL